MVKTQIALFLTGICKCQTGRGACIMAKTINRKFILPVLFAGVVVSCSGSESPACEEPPCEPEAAVSTFDIVDGFKVELFVSEPLIRDPVAMEVDEKGRIYVVEDPGYPENRDGGGTVRLLKDTTGDGLPDESTIFAAGLRAPRGVISWKKGILVTDAPEIIYLEDTNGDGQADLRRVVMSGFSYGNPQLGVNTPIYGLDNWIYVAHRQGNSTPYFKDQPGGGKIAGRANIRFRPDSYEWEPTAASSQFGHTFDAFGRHLLVSWNNHVYQEVIDAKYLRRNPDLLVAPATADIAVHGAVTDVFPITKNPRYELFTHTGTTTATCGIVCYLGGAFPDEYRGATFVAEPGHNLLHADRIAEDGTTLAASRMHEDREFLASTDRWFRPVNSYIGPDGALYVIDYYRDVIEQPRFLSQEILESGILFEGSDRGRIFRVSAEGADPASWADQIDLARFNSAMLVELLDYDNIWWRRTAQRLLVERNDADAVELLEHFSGFALTPEGRVHALWTLEGMDSLSPALIEAALADSSPRVREQAVRLAELHLESAGELVHSLLEMSEDSDARVRFQLLATLGDIDSGEARSVHNEMLYEYIEDEWMQLAGLSAGNLAYRKLLDEAFTRFAQEESPGRKAYFRRLGMLIGAQHQPDDVALLVESVSGQSREADNWWQAASLEGLAEGLRHIGDPGEKLEFIQEFVANISLRPGVPALRKAAREVMAVVGAPSGLEGERVFQQAEQIASDSEADGQLRADAIGLLDLDGSVQYKALLIELVHPREPGLVRAEAARALRHIEGREVGEILLDKWNEMTPQVRAAAMETLLADDERIALVLDAVARGNISRSSITSQQTNRLMLHPDNDLRLHAQSLLGLSDEPRSVIVERYMAVTEMDGDAGRGRHVYEQTCAMCHQINGRDGVPFGPDLAGSRNIDTEALLVNILMPNAEISAGYEQWRVQRVDGSIIHGAISSETPGSVTFRNSSGQETTIPRNEIQSMAAINESPMPEGLEQQISVEEMADLLEYLRTR